MENCKRICIEEVKDYIFPKEITYFEERIDTNDGCVYKVGYMVDIYFRDEYNNVTKDCGVLKGIDLETEVVLIANYGEFNTIKFDRILDVC